jgi:hypothetical protein
MKQVLRERFGFGEKEICTLSDKQATREGMTKAFQDHLIAQAQPGAIVVFYYCGHGQQVKDDNGDEWDDGKDESLVPYDYLTINAEDGTKTNLRDDQLGDLLQQLREKMLGPDGQLQGNITVFLDSCFSGSATRGQPARGRLRAQGRGWIETLDGEEPKPTGKGPSEGASGLLARGEARAQGYVILSASRNDQPAYQDLGKPVFTYYLLRALNQATPGTTYRSLFERVQAEVRGAVCGQEPQLEGEIDQLLFSGTALPASPYLVVQEVEGDTVVLPVGELHGTTPGSRFALYRAGSNVKEERNRLAEAQVTEVETTSCRAQLTEAFRGQVKEKDLRAVRAVETLHNYGESRLKVLFAPGTESRSQKLKGLDALTTDGVTSDNYDVLIRVMDGKWVLERKGGSVLEEMASQNLSPERVQETLLGEWRWQFLTQLRNDSPDPEVKIELRLVPVNVKTEARDGQEWATQYLGDREVERTDGNHLIFHEKDYVMIELRNPSHLDVYVTILDLAPNGGIYPVFPHPDFPLDNKVPADGEPHRPPFHPYVIRLEKPYGSDVYKAIATREPVDFSSLLDQKAIAKRAPEALLKTLPPEAQPLGWLLLSASTGQRGKGPPGVKPTYWNTAEVIFELQPK